MTKLIETMTAQVPSGCVAPLLGGRASSAIQGRPAMPAIYGAALSGLALAGVVLRDRHDEAVTTGFATSTFPGPPAWSPPLR